MRAIRSLGKCTGRTTSGQTKALEELGPQFLLLFQTNALDFIATHADKSRATGLTTEKQQAIVLEIGFGMRDATAHIAALMPDTHILCCEVHDLGAGALFLRCPFGGEPASEGAEPAQPASLCGQATGLGCDTVLHVMATPIGPVNAMAWCW